MTGFILSNATFKALTFVRGLPRPLFTVVSAGSSLLGFFTTVQLVLEAHGLSLLLLEAESLSSSLHFLSSSLSLFKEPFPGFVFCGEHFGGNDLETVLRGMSSSLEVSDEHLLQDSELELLVTCFFFTAALSCKAFRDLPSFFFTVGLVDFLVVAFRGTAAILSLRPVSQDVTEKCGLRVVPCLELEHSQSLADVSLLLEF